MYTYRSIYSVNWLQLQTTSFFKPLVIKAKSDSRFENFLVASANFSLNQQIKYLEIK